MTAFLIALVVFGIACLVSKINKENEFQEKRRLEKTDVALQNKITKEVRTKVLQDLSELNIDNPIKLYDALLNYALVNNLDNVDYSTSDENRKYRRERFADSAVLEECVSRRKYWELHGVWNVYSLLEMRADQLTPDQMEYVEYLLYYAKQLRLHGYTPKTLEQQSEYESSQIGSSISEHFDTTWFIGMNNDVEKALWLFAIPPIPNSSSPTITSMLDDSSDHYGYHNELRLLFDCIVRQITKGRLLAHGIYAMSKDGVHESWYQELQKDTKITEHKRVALTVALNGAHKLWNEIKARNLATNHELGQIVSKYTVNNNPSLWAMDNLLSPKETVSGLTLDQKLEVCSNFQKELQEILRRGSPN